MPRRCTTASASAAACCIEAWIYPNSAASLAGGILFGIGRRADADGGTRELGVAVRLIGPAAEGVAAAIVIGGAAADHRIRRHDIAFAGGAVSDHPIASVGEAR